MPKQKQLQRRLSSLQAKTQKVQGKLGQTALGAGPSLPGTTGPSAPGLTSLVDPAAGTLTGDMQTPMITDQSGDMQLPVDTLPGDGGVGSTPLTSQDLVGQFQTQADEARAANEARYGQGLGIYDQIISMFQPGGGFGAGQMEQYERTKEQALATQQQSAITSGLGNVTTQLGAESAYEQRVGVPFKLQLADLVTERLTGAMGEKAGFIERREDEAPDPRLMADLVMGAEAGPVTGEGVAGEGGEGTAAAGAGGYFTDGAAGTPSYAAGGQISNVQYRMEAKRQRTILQSTNKVRTLENRLRNKNKQLTKLGPDDPKRERLEDQIAKLEGNMQEAQDRLDENADPIVDSGIFAAEQQRKKERIQKANQAEKAALKAGTGRKYVTTPYTPGKQIGGMSWLNK
jgi:hypothetical protein